MASKRDPAWQYGDETPAPMGAKFKYVKCRFCNKVITSGVTRFKQHLAHTHKNVTACPSVPKDVKEAMMASLKKFRVEKKKQQNEYNDITDAGAYFGSGSGSGYGSNPAQSQSVRGPIDRFIAHEDDDADKETEGTNPSQEQPKDMVQHAKDARRLVSLDIGRFFFENGIAFNCIESPSFVSMCRSIAAYGKGLKTPSRYELCTWILKEEVERTKVSVEEIKKTWIQTGVSILSDGWKDMRGRSLINILVNNSYGTVFLKSIDASDAVKDANMIFKLLDDIVEEVGEELVVQVVTDNASNYKAAGKLLMEKRKRLYWTPCAAHCIDLMLEKLGELPQHMHALQQARKVSNFIYNHGFVLSLMRKFTKRELVRPAVTRFATAFLTLESLLQSKQPLEAMFTSTDWSKSTWASKNDGKIVKKIILSDRFWRCVEYALNTTRPLVKVLRMVDGEQMPAMGFIYGAIDTAKEEIAKNLGNVLGDYKEIWDIIDAKWDNQLHCDLHAAGHFLNPRNQYADNFSSHHEIKKGLIMCMEKLLSREELMKADLQLDEFRRKQGLFGRATALATYETRTPADWWIQFGDATPELQSFAVRVLSLTCSSSACERNWSMFNQVHTKKRNRLTTMKLNSLVYIMYNRRLRAKRIKVKSQVMDPLEVEELASDDEWYVPNAGEGRTLPTPNVGSEQLDILDNENERTPSSSKTTSSRKRKASNNSSGQNKRGKGKEARYVASLVDEEEEEYEEEEGFDEEEAEGEENEDGEEDDTEFDDLVI